MVKRTEKREDGLYRVIDSDKPLNFFITPQHEAAAVSADPCHCVVAKALDEAIPGGFDAIEVGATVTKITCEATKVIVRYGTSARLRKALQAFDLTGKWNLPPGQYSLRPIGKREKLGGRPPRWNKRKEKEVPGVQDRFRSRALPTRRVSKCPSVCNAKSNQ